MGPDTRRSLATSLVVLASVLLAGAALAGYARRALFDSDQFADRATSALQDPACARVAERVTDGVVLATSPTCSPRGRSSRPRPGVVGGARVPSLFRRAVLDAHRAVFERDQNRSR